LLSILSGILLSIVYPPLDFGVLSFVALIPLLLVLDRSNSLESLLWGYLTGVILAGSFFYPLMAIDRFPVTGYVVIILLCGVFLGAFSVLYSQVISKRIWPPVIVAPALWVAIEFLRANISFLSNPGYLLGYSLHNYPSLIQVASVTSVYGVSFMIVFINGMIAEILLYRSKRENTKSLWTITNKWFFIRIAASFMIFFIILGFGLLELKKDGQKSMPGSKIGLIQINISREESNKQELKTSIMSKYQELTAKAAVDGIDLIVWPESSTPTHFTMDPDMYDQVTELVQSIKVPLVLGSSSRDKSGQRALPGVRLNNSAFLINPDGEIETHYKKIRLVPFWEFLPLEQIFQWPKWLVPDRGYTLPGEKAVIFNIKEHRFGVVICWEVLFPDTFRRFTRKNPDFMLNLSNENVFGWTAAPYKVQAMAVFRAVESRKSLLRCNLTGLTSHIDPWGRETARVTDANGDDLMVQGYLTVGVPIMAEITFYTKYGDVFAYLCIAWSSFMLGYALVLHIRGNPDKEKN